MLMRTRSSLALALLSLLALMALHGCRAFEPEVVIVNHPPETYLTGAPIEGGGGIYHYHLFWYGTDVDGEVTRFVWALTDSSIQDPETDEDEEDARFNPAENILTLQIGHWTTRTDSVFDFEIDQGSITSIDKTFHIVAVDDRGDFDKTPARLYFLSNAIGRPFLEFFSDTLQTPETAFADYDTIGYGRPFVLSWRGSTPNITNYAPELLAQRDTVPPYDDGLFGFKYRLPTDVSCNEAAEDCWSPRRFDPEQNREISFFGDGNWLEFHNDESGLDVFHRRLVSGVHTLLVNTIDVAGVELQRKDQALNFVVNYDPDTRLLRGETDPFYPDDPNVYPYYKVYRPDGTVETHTFAEEDTVPHRAVAVFKAIGWDDPRDIRLSDIPGEEPPGYGVRFQGRFDAVGRYLGGANSLFRFSSTFSSLSRSVWDDYDYSPDHFVGSSDTLSFIVGPFDYTYIMRSEDELGRRDGTPDMFHFYGNRPPHVNGVVVSTDTLEVEYIAQPTDTGIDTLYCTIGTPPAGHPDWVELPVYSNFTTIWYDPVASAVFFDEPASTVGLEQEFGRMYLYEVRIHADDDEQEQLFIPRTAAGQPTYGNPRDRLMSCRYEIVSERDPLNAIKDGNGADDLAQVTYRLHAAPALMDSTYDDNGVWHLRVRVFVPIALLSGGPDSYLATLRSSHPDWSENKVQRAFSLLTGQLGACTVTVIPRDASIEDINPDHCAYVYYDGTRAPAEHSESCSDQLPDVTDRLKYRFFYAEGEPYRKYFDIRMVYTADGQTQIFPPLPSR